MSDRLVTVCVVIISNEILSGRTQDTNIAFLGERLNTLGVRLTEARVISAKTICEPQCTA